MPRHAGLRHMAYVKAPRPPQGHNLWKSNSSTWCSRLATALGTTSGTHSALPDIQALQPWEGLHNTIKHSLRLCDCVRPSSPKPPPGVPHLPGLLAQPQAQGRAAATSATAAGYPAGQHDLHNLGPACLHAQQAIRAHCWPLRPISICPLCMTAAAIQGQILQQGQLLQCRSQASNTVGWHPMPYS